MLEIFLQKLGLTLDMLGKILVAITALRVHYRFWREHKVDENVFKEMKSESRLGILGIALIVIGYLLQIFP